MEINDKLLKKLFHLSALHFSPAQAEPVQAYLKETLSHFEKIKKVNTEGISPLFSPLNPPLRLREDQVCHFKDKEKLLDQAPQKKGALVKAPLSF